VLISNWLGQRALVRPTKRCDAPENHDGDPQLGRMEGGDTYVEFDPKVVDAYGIPALRIRVSFGDNEYAMVAEMAKASVEMMEAASGRTIQPFAVPEPQPASATTKWGSRGWETTPGSPY
jgi:hypothetical protein